MGKRNYIQEKVSGQLELLDGLRTVKTERDSGAVDILQLAQIFAFCSLPYRPTEERQVSHTARLGDASSVEVVFTAMQPGVPIAYGNDRSLLYWLIDRAIRDESAYVSWDCARDYLTDMKQTGGGRHYELLRERFQRVSSTAITVIRRSAGSEQKAILPIIKKSNLPSSITGADQGRRALQRASGRCDLGLQFDEDFVRDFMSHRVPVLRSLLIATHARPQMQDCMFFLIWRSYSAAKDSLIPWDSLRDQFWQADSNKARIRLRFKEAITLIRTTWPELQAEARTGGLWIAPPRNGVQFATGLNGPLHIKKQQARKLLESIRRPAPNSNLDWKQPGSIFK